jgi:hypothetical protein
MKRERGLTRQLIAAISETKYRPIAMVRNELESWVANPPKASKARPMGMAPRARPIKYSMKRLDGLGGIGGGTMFLDRSGLGCCDIVALLPFLHG